jgi:tight adherence protein B
MLLILALVFIAVFAIAALLLAAGRSTASKESERTVATLEAALAASPYRATDASMDIRKRDVFSDLPALNRWLMRLELSPRLQLLISQADLDWTAGSLLLMCLLCWLIPAYLMYLRSANLFLSFALAVITGAIPLVYVLQKRRRRFNKFEAGFAQTLDLMVSALRAGHSLVSALDIAATESPDPIGGELRICFDEQNYGLDMKSALTNLTTRIPLHDVRIVVTAILIQRESGGNLAEIFEKAAYLIRERFRLKRQVRIHTAQGRMTGWILSFLPLVLGIALYFVNPKYMSLLWTRAIGVKLLYTAAIMMVAGALIIRRIVRMEV